MARIKLRHLLILFMVVTMVFILLFIPSQSKFTYSMQSKFFSPGKIHYKHTSDRGEPIMCRECHTPGKAIDNSSCTGCHTPQNIEDISPALSQSHKLFARHDQCLRCHTEHLGSYSPITTVGLTPDEHKELPKPINSEKCTDCHLQVSKIAHSGLKKEKCIDCHNNWLWKTDFTHLSYLSKGKTSLEVLGMCKECHIDNNHYNFSTSPKTQQTCLYCHNFWSKRKQEPIPFPEKLFPQPAPGSRIPIPF